MSPARLTAAQRREQLILDHLHLVERIARKVRGIFTHHVDHDDLLACGRLGLVKAAAAYRPRKGVFEHFAFFYIRGAMIDANRRSAYREATHMPLEMPRGPGEDSGLKCSWAEHRPSPDPLPDALAARSQQARMASAAIARLPEDQRFVLERSLQGHDLEATAAARGRSLTWARVRLRAARETVAAEMRQAA